MFPPDEGDFIVLSPRLDFPPRLTFQEAVPTHTASTVCIARGCGAMHLHWLRAVNLLSTTCVHGQILVGV